MWRNREQHGVIQYAALFCMLGTILKHRKTVVESHGESWTHGDFRKLVKTSGDSCRFINFFHGFMESHEEL